VAVGATHYDFIREIPMLASYEVRVSLKAWDQKWVSSHHYRLLYPGLTETLKAVHHIQVRDKIQENDASSCVGVQCQAQYR
jgi:hypothetical protein